MNEPFEERPDSDEQPEQEVDTKAKAPEPTGHPVVDRALGSLSDLDELPVAEHAAVFEQAQRDLRDALSGAADAPEDGAGS